MPEPKGHDEEKLSHTALDIGVAIFAFLIALAILGAYVGGLLSWYERFLDWFYTHWISFIRTIKIIIITLDVFLIGFLMYVLKKYNELDTAEPVAETVVHVVRPETEVAKTWHHIRELAESKNPSDWNMAIIRADALLDDILRHEGYEGDTMADRLKIVDPTKLPSLERVWSVHRLRNSIAHDPLEQHTKETVVTALKTYAQALTELGMMEKTSEKLSEKSLS